ncbi:MAG: hypothetical protein CM15mP66_03510 [Pseudomonadota bacterium]|nr:MAG: hypothetical protein CM15mP66_03510 [Pseudomonadota bacterium]
MINVLRISFRLSHPSAGHVFRPGTFIVLADSYRLDSFQLSHAGTGTSDRDQEDFHDEASIAKQLEESQRIEQEARDFYSKPSTVRYQLSGMERLRILRGQNQNPDEDSEDMPIDPHQDLEDSSEDEANAIWNQAVISSITFRKSPEQES